MTNDFLKRTWVQIDLDALSNNVKQIRLKLNPDCKFMAIVKADAHGHGDQFCAAEMAKNGVDWFGVSNLEEALSLRSANIQQPILILGTTPPDKALLLAKYSITQTVLSLEYASQLQCEAAQCGVKVDVHIKIDTGMSRIGFDSFDAQHCMHEVLQTTAMENLNCEGIFTHFSCADEDTVESNAYTHAQYERFMHILDLLKQRGVHFKLRHCCNSAATLRFPQMHLDMVRPGIILYGLYPDDCCRPFIKIFPIMQLKSIVSMVKTLPGHRFISYGRQYETTEERQIATVPIGYADGYHRLLSNKGVMLVNGLPAPVVGRVCMDQLMPDVTGIPNVQAGDVVTIIGKDGDRTIPVENLAKATGTINYEIVCLIGKRVPRIYRHGSLDCGIARYVPVR